MRTRTARWATLNIVLAAAILATLIAATQAAGQTTIPEWGVPTANSQPTNLAVAPSGHVWFTEFNANKIGRVDQNGVFQEFDITTPNSQPWGITVAPNGRIWFTEAAGNKIGNVNSGGERGQDNIPTADSQPRGIALDSSGNVWFAESAGNKIGRLSGATFSEFNVPSSNAQPWGVAIDPSGYVWFTEYEANKIGRFNPSTGSFTNEYVIPTQGSGPRGIAIDGSGNIWFAEYDANKIGMMTPGGVFTEYPISTGGGKPTSVAVDKAGGVWFTASGSNLIGRVFNGAVMEYGSPTAGSTPYGIAVDGDGNVWFTQQSANKIAKAVGFAPTAAPTATPTSTAVPAATATPVPTATPPPTAPRDARFFSQTGFRIDNDVFWDYFNKRGGVFTFGYPVSRTFTFLGFTTQFFQRSIMQLGPDGSARTMNLLDPGLMPYTQINASNFPAPDPALAQVAPVPGLPDYDVRVQEFVRNYAPNQFEGLNVNFYQAFFGTVKLESAFPQGGGDPALLPLLNLEMWGVPTSRPVRDPNNSKFIYLRFQRGIMHYDATNNATQGLLLADYLKGIITGQGLPADLDQQARGSQFYKQYDPSRPNWLARPEQLPATDLSFAFERQ